MITPDNSQQTREQQQGVSEEEPEGGYLAMYHKVLEEEYYGPNSPLDRVGRVYMYLSHELLRDSQIRKAIRKSEIQKSTGLDASAVKRALRYLEEDERILVHRKKLGKVWQENEYELHPKRFGSKSNWYKNNPTLKFVRGGKSTEKDGDVGANQPLDSGANKPPAPRANEPLDPGANQPLGNAPKPIESLGNLAPNNCINNLNNSLNKEEKVDKNNWNSVREFLLTQFPNDAKRLDGTYKQISERGYEREGSPPRYISNLSAWLFSAYKDIRKEYSHHDDWRSA